MMATLKKTVSTKVENLVRVPAAEIEGLLRERYPRIPSSAEMTVATDSGPIHERMEEIRFAWNTNEGDSNEAEIPRTEPPRKEPAAIRLARDPEE